MGKTNNEERDQGMRPEWKARQSRKRVSSVIKTFLGVMLLGLMVGLCVVYNEQIRVFLTSTAPAPSQNGLPKPFFKPVVTVPAIELKPVTPPVTVSRLPVSIPPVETIAAGEEAIAMKLIEDGRGLLEKFDFDKARSLFKEAALKKAGEKIRVEAKLWEAKAIGFDTATRHVSVSEFAIAETSYLYQTYDGREFQGLKLAETPEQIRIQIIPTENPATLGRSIIPISKSELKNIVPVSIDQRHDEFLYLLASMDNTAAIQRSSDFYDLVFLSKRLGLGRECIGYLNRAYDGGSGHMPDPTIGDSFRKEVIRRAIMRASKMLSVGRKTFVQDELSRLLKTLPNYDLAQAEVDAFKIQLLNKYNDGYEPTLKLVPATKIEISVEPTKPGPAIAVNHPVEPPSTPKSKPNNGIEDDDSVDVVADNHAIRTNGATASLVEKANKEADEGLKLFRGFNRPGNNNSQNNQFLRGAIPHLEAAIELYGQAFILDPSNKALENRQTELGSALYGCRKYQTL